MKSLIPSWLRKPTAAPDDLAAQLESARTELAAKLQLVERAELAFDQSGDPAALTSAQADADSARLHVARAERLLAAAERASAAAARVDLEAKRDALAEALAPQAVSELRRPLELREADLLEALVHVRGERHDLDREINARRAELARVREQLGEPPAYLVADPVSLYSVTVTERLKGLAQSLPRDDPRRHYAEQLL